MCLWILCFKKKIKNLTHMVSVGTVASSEVTVPTPSKDKIEIKKQHNQFPIAL